MSTATEPTIHVVLPVRDMRELALGCATAVRAQLRPGDTFIVVDDGSTDGTAQALTAHGIDVVESTTSRGPYVARQIAAQTTDADVVVFVDGRSQPLPGWLDAHRALFRDPAVALTCTGTRVRKMPGLAPRIFQASNMFEISTKLDVPGRLAFYPTANLGVRRAAFVAVGGFRDMRSGSDADLCWRIQLDGHGIFAADRRMLMEWVPRASVRSVVEQWVRYGKSSALLEAIHHDAAGREGSISTRRKVLPALRQSFVQMRRTPFATCAQLVLDALNMFTYQREKRRIAQLPASAITPAPIDSAPLQSGSTA